MINAFWTIVGVLLPTQGIQDIDLKIIAALLAAAILAVFIWRRWGSRLNALYILIGTGAAAVLLAAIAGVAAVVVYRGQQLAPQASPPLPPTTTTITATYSRPPNGAPLQSVSAPAYVENQTVFNTIERPGLSTEISYEARVQVTTNRLRFFVESWPFELSRKVQIADMRDLVKGQQIEIPVVIRTAPNHQFEYGYVGEKKPDGPRQFGVPSPTTFRIAILGDDKNEQYYYFIVADKPERSFVAIGENILHLQSK